MLYSPTLHQIQNGFKSSTISSLQVTSTQMVIVDGVTSQPKKILAFENSGLQCFSFDCSSSLDTAALPSPSLSVPKAIMLWPYDFVFTGGFASCVSGNTANPGMNFGVHRNPETNVFTNSPTISSLNALIISGTALLGRSNFVAAHASHALWKRGDQIAIYLTSASNNWRGGKVYLFGYKKGFTI